MDVRIGVTYSPRELQMEIDDDSAEDVQGQVSSALADDTAVLWLEDRRGRKIGVPSDKLAYIEFGSPGDDRRIGFGAI